MKAYRVYGECRDWECHCESTLQCFFDKERADRLAAMIDKGMVIDFCGFCGNDGNDVSVLVEELEID